MVVMGTQLNPTKMELPINDGLEQLYRNLTLFSTYQGSLRSFAKMLQSSNSIREKREKVIAGMIVSFLLKIIIVWILMSS